MIQNVADVNQIEEATQEMMKIFHPMICSDLVGRLLQEWYAVVYYITPVLLFTKTDSM